MTVRAKRLTSRDVAAHAGVSQSIVSFYFTGKRPVGKETRGRIERAIEELGYRPNRVAQSLRTQRTGQVAVFIPYVVNQLYAAYSAGAEQALAEAGYLTMIFSNRTVPEHIDAYFDAVADSQVDGLILFPYADDVPRIERLRERGIPIVLVDRTVPLPPHENPIDSVLVDNEGSVRAAVAHLLDQGHRHIGLIGSTNPTYGEPRLNGYRNAYAHRGLSPDPGHIALGGGRIEDGITMTEALLARAPELTALVVTMNWPTLGALEALHRNGIAMPERMSFIGFDTDDAAHSLPNRIAAIRYPAVRLGRAAGQMLIHRLRTGMAGPPQATRMGADLFLGSSTAPNET